MQEQRKRWHRVSIPVHPDLYGRAVAVAKQWDAPIGEIVRDALLTYVERAECEQRTRAHLQAVSS